MKNSEIFDQTADLYESGTKDWYSGGSQSPDGNGYCMGRAMGVVSGCTEWMGEEVVSAFLFANNHLQQPLQNWNDLVATSKGQVIDKLRELAKLAREEEELAHGTSGK